MGTNLTIKLDKHIVERVKMYAKERNTSLPNLVSNYFHELTMESSEEEEEISPLIKSLSGIVPYISEKDEKEMYTHYLMGSNK
ncbi:MAG: DUF6364 family protein [Bacteroidetes bacterium]|nr:DUF6364 family protein [Bacteroidota bacterium]